MRGRWRTTPRTPDGTPPWGGDEGEQTRDESVPKNKKKMPCNKKSRKPKFGRTTKGPNNKSSVAPAPAPIGPPEVPLAVAEEDTTVAVTQVKSEQKVTTIKAAKAVIKKQEKTIKQQSEQISLLEDVNASAVCTAVIIYISSFPSPMTYVLLYIFLCIQAAKREEELAAKDEEIAKLREMLAAYERKVAAREEDVARLNQELRREKKVANQLIQSSVKEANDRAEDAQRRAAVAEARAFDAESYAEVT